MKKILLIICLVILITGCSNKPGSEEKNAFQELYKVDTDIVKSMTYEELLALTESKTGVVFIGKDTKAAKELAQIFCDNLCECESVNKAYFVNSDDITDDKLLEIFNVEELAYPIIIAYRNGELVSYYDNKINPKKIDEYLYDLITAAHPTVCTESC